MRDTVVDVKEAFRCMVGPSLEGAMGGSRHDPAAGLRLCVAFRHVATAGEADFLQPASGSQGRQHKHGWGKRGRQEQQLPSSINYSSAQAVSHSA